MKRIAAIFVLVGTFFLGAQAFAQPICDFGINQSSPTYLWYDKTGTLYNFSTTTNPWEIINTSTIGNPVTNPYVLHTNGSPGQSPQWLTSQNMAAFNWQYNQLQWTFWFGRRANNGQNGGNQDGNIVWLYVNQRTGLDNPSALLEGIKVTWHHDNNVDAIRLSEVHGSIEYTLGDFTLLANLSDYEWGSTVKVLRIPGGYPNGSTVRYQLWMSTPDSTSSPTFVQHNKSAETDASAASIYKRIDTTLTSPWHPSNGNTFLGVHSYYASSRKNAHEYNQLCFTDLGPTPVELTDFNAMYRDGQVHLNWNTATESNSLGFEVQRSVEHNGEWEAVAFVDGKGTSNSTTKYSYVDDPNFDGASTIAYRLKQIDRDGSYEYSNTILVSIAPETADVLYNFPNPFNPNTNISFTLKNADKVSLSVYNTAGEKVGELYNETQLNSGFHTSSFNGTGLPSGTYFYKLTTSAGTMTNTMVLSK